MDLHGASVGPRRSAVTVLLGAAFALWLWSTEHAVAWETAAHQEITVNALSVLPHALRSALEQYDIPLVNGALDPDRNRTDDHNYNLSRLRGTGVTNAGGAAAALDRFAKAAEEALRRGAPMNEIAFTLGQAAHFIQDLAVPLHTVQGETPSEHYAYERRAFYTAFSSVEFNGFHRVQKYKCLAKETATWSNRFVDDALKDDPPHEVIRQTWIRAVNDTANLWMTIFVGALGAGEAAARFGIPPPAGVVGKGWLC